MEIRFNLTDEDQRILLERLGPPGRQNGFGYRLWTGAAALGLAGAGLSLWQEGGDADWRAVELFLVALLFGLATLVEGLRRLCGWFERRQASWAGEHELALTPAGLAVVKAGRPEFLPWPEIRAFEEIRDYWFFHRKAAAGYPVPQAALPDPASRLEFAERVRTLWTRHPENRGRFLPDRPAPVRTLRQVLADLGANLAGGYRFAVFRPSAPAGFRTTAQQLALLLGLQLLSFLMADYLTAGRAPRFDGHGFNDFGAAVALFLLSGVAIGTLSDGIGLLSLLVVLAASELVTFTVYFLLYGATLLAQLDHEGLLLTGLYGIWIVWNLSLVFRAVVLLYACPRPAALLPVSLFALFNLALAHALPDQPFFSAAPEDTQFAEGPDIDGEDLFYRQPELLEEAIRDLAPGRPGVTDLYFVGFAGEADEHVFAHEIEYARELFDRRFGTAGRSVALVNSPDTTDRLALANSHNLETVLQALADRMDPGEDVLFLFLTSHGSADHRLSVQFPSLPLNNLSAQRLKDLLDRSGIRNRVIVVSACYSGGFLDVLKDDDSLILTAASRDRPSFGCGTESEFTYFGQAYFVEALQRTRSFIDAFEQARTWIEAREQEEGKKPSLPQLHVGAGIVPKLRALEAGSKS